VDQSKVRLPAKKRKRSRRKMESSSDDFNDVGEYGNSSEEEEAARLVCACFAVDLCFSCACHVAPLQECMHA